MSTCKSARVNNTDHDSEDPTSSNDTTISTGASTQVLCDDSELNPVVSRKRWFILFGICIYGLCSTIASNTSPVLDLLLKLLDLEVSTYLYINQIFNYLIAFLGVPLARFVDRFGIRVAVHTSACFFALSGIFGALLFFTELPGWYQYKMYYYIISRLFGSVCIVFFFLLPLKVSETWFPKSERSIAWMIMFLQLEIGVCIVAYTYPRIITDIADFKILAYIIIACATITLIACISLITKSKPEVPPSKRAASNDIAPFLVSLKRIVSHPDILLHQTHAGFFTAVNLALSGVMQNLFSSIGHDQIFAGNYMLINAMISIILCIIMASFVHKVHNITLACKFGSFFQTVQFVALLMAVLYPLSGWMIIGMSIVLTCCRSWTVPHFNNMTAHLASGVVSQPIIIGFSLVVTPILMTIVEVTFAYLIETKTILNKKTNDYHNSLIFLIAVSITNEAFYQMFFRGKTSTSTNDPSQPPENHYDAPAAEHDNTQLER